jgi:hypothetical protein
MTERMTAAFRAGFVRRWHCNPELSHTADRIDGHSGRVARIVLMLHPDPTVRLLKAALIHDDGESVIGDVKAPSKDANPQMALWLSEAETAAREGIWGDDDALTESEHDWLKFADRLDAYMWANFHAPHVMGDDGWPDAREWLLGQAYILNVVDDVFASLAGAS